MSEHHSMQLSDLAVLETLQPATQLELLDVVDDLRAQGLNEHVDLPQLIVCGDQSSGKSSVLAAISGVPFPKKDNLCTRFATEVVLRRDDDAKEIRVSVTITPSSVRRLADRHALESFTKDLTSMDDLPAVMTEASLAMGLGASGSAFSADILRLEVRGPKMPQLTIVDLPGLIHSENKFQSADDITLVNALVEDYMSQERSIILAVISAKNDYANQIVLTKARKKDPEGRRTLGIITKPDTLHPGSASEASFLGLAQNQDVKFSLGWHVVRNTDLNEPLEINRDDIEVQFFKTSRWNQLNEKDRGIYSLRMKLSQVLFQQIRRELPGLISEIIVATGNTKSCIARMGRSRANLSEKRMFVMELGERFRDLCFAACEGLYENPFFDEVSSATAPRRLRAVVQNANINFANKMLASPVRISVDLSIQDDTSVKQRAKQLVHSFRGKELPGTFNPILIGQLFRELSYSWQKRTSAHTNNVWLSARTAVLDILEAVAEGHVRDACMKILIDPELERMQKRMEQQLDEYMSEFRRHPITYNHYLTETVEKIRNSRDRDEAFVRCRKLFKGRDHLISHDTGLIVDTLFQRKEATMDDLAAQNLADYAEAYYKVALKRVIDELPAHVIEPAIFTSLPKLLDAARIFEMPNHHIESIGGESDAALQHREALVAKLEVFDRCSLICKVYAEKVAAVEGVCNVDNTKESFVDVQAAPERESPDHGLTDRPDGRVLTHESPYDIPPHEHAITVENIAVNDDELGGSSTTKKKKAKMAGKWSYAD